MKDLIAARWTRAAPIAFEVDDVRLEGIDSTDARHPVPARRGRGVELECDFVAGCDGFHGVSRDAIPPGC